MTQFLVNQYFAVIRDAGTVQATTNGLSIGTNQQTSFIGQKANRRQRAKAPVNAATVNILI